MSLSPLYVTDTTVWEDYFVNKNSNVREWLKNTISSNEGMFIVTPVVVIELVMRLYYARKISSKGVNLAIKHLTNVLRRVSIPSIDKQIVKEITNKIGLLPLIPECQVGELSFLNLLNQPEVIIVTSDGGFFITIKM